MQPFFAFWAGWLTLLGLCLGITALWQPDGDPFALRRRVAVLPPVTLCCAVLVLLVFGFCNLLRIGAFLLVALGLAGWTAAGFALARRSRPLRNTLWRCFFCPGWLLTFVGSLLLAVLLAVRQPLFTQWDEFSFWGLAAKTVWRNDALYTLVQNTNLAARSYPPALALLSYLFCFSAKTFTPWVVFAAYGVFLFAVFGTVLSCCPEGFSAGGILCAAALVLTPFATEYHLAGQQLSSYVCAYGDSMLGVAAAGCVAVWFALQPVCPGEDTGAAPFAAGLTVCPVIAFLVCIKDVGLPLALVITLICAADCLIRLVGQKGSVCKGLSVALMQGGTAVAAYLVWSAHLAYALSQNRSETGGSAGLSTFGMVTQGLKELCGIGRSDKFSAVLSGMVQAFLHRRVTVFGSGLVSCGVICLLILLGCYLLPAGAKRRAVCFGLCTGLGYLGYTFFQLICYVYVFSEVEGRQLASYERYMGSYTLFWLVGTLCLLAADCRDALFVHPQKTWKKQLLTAAGFFTVFALTVFRLSGCDLQLTNGLTQNAYQQKIECGAGEAFLLTDTDMKGNAADCSGEKVWLISQWDDGGRWYRYAYALEGLPLLYLEGGSTVLTPESDLIPEDALCLSKDSFFDFIDQNGITLLLIDVADYDFMQEFGSLFPDGLAGAEQGITGLYRVTRTDDGLQLTRPEVTF